MKPSTYFIRYIRVIRDIDVEFDVEFEAQYTPARGMYGAWEYSSPEESCVSIIGVRALTAVHGLTPVQVEVLALSNLQEIEDVCFESFMLDRIEGEEI